jgi:hypothetical protein
MVEGCAGISSTLTTLVIAVPLPQALDGVIVMVPEEAPTVTVIEFVPCPETIVHPPGKVQVKVIPATLVTLYVSVLPRQGDVLPENPAGWLGTKLTGETESCDGVPLPQALDGVTVIVPEPAPTNTVTLLELPPPVCIHPEGKDHVYVTPGTFVTE